MTIHQWENLTLFASQSPHSPGHLDLEPPRIHRLSPGVTTQIERGTAMEAILMAISHLQVPFWGSSVLKFGDVLSPCPSSNSL